MNKEEYKKLLLDPRWKEKRLKILERDGNRCTQCGTTYRLQAHHLIYEDTDPWESRDEDLITLCTYCHNEWHKNNKPSNREYSIEFMTNMNDGLHAVADTKVTSSKKITNFVIKDVLTPGEPHYCIVSSLSSICCDIEELCKLQNSGNIKIKSTISGNFEATINTYISFKRKSN
jgi:hypothetical protein